MKNLKEKIKTINWHIFHKRSRSPFFHQIALVGPGIQRKGIPFDHRVKYFGSFLDYVCIDEIEKSKLRDKIIKHLKKQPEFLIKLMQQAYVEHKNNIKKWQQYIKKEFTIQTNEQLAQEFKNYVNNLLNFGIYITLPLFVEEYMEQTLLSSFTKIFGGEAQKWFNIAVNPTKNGSVLQEELALLELAERPDIKERDLIKHTKNFSWMANVGYTETYYNVSYYKSRLEEIKKKKNLKKEEIENQRNKHRQQFNILLKKISKDQYLNTITKTANESVYFRSYRTEMYYSSARYFTNLFKEIAKRLGIQDYKDLLYLYWTEIYNNLTKDSKANLDLINARKEGYAFLSDFDNKFWYWDSKEALEMYQAFKSSQKIGPDQKEIKGNGSYPGKIKGKVVVVMSIDELDKVKEGNVLIAHATNINFVPALKKVSAIVTEEGGILSHASIISRELRIPCIIGTKIATQVFKDGDLVEVDAEKGIVRKIK